MTSYDLHLATANVYTTSANAQLHIQIRLKCGNGHITINVECQTQWVGDFRHWNSTLDACVRLVMYDFLLVFYSDIIYQWNHCCVIS